MASLRKMQILGIRSFGPDENDAATVTFNTPLTLILGQNGCGKTTIIEALKYATCGEVPANTSQGSAFVHDPKINNRIEVRGQVKLVCNTVKGDQLCIARSVQVQQKLKKLSFKTLDSTITRINQATNEKESLSGRCADVDTEMCIALGVTKPILHYVIFCHQEDSCWPLEENKKLKEKFDAIFDATKYNKCLEQMRKERKVAQSDLKVSQNNLIYLKKFQAEAERKRNVMKETNDKLAEVVKEINALEDQVEVVKGRRKKVEDKAASCATINADRSRLKGTLNEVQNSKREILETITEEFEGSDAQLDEKIKSFQNHSRNQESELKQLKTEIETLSRKSDKIQGKIGDVKCEQGKLTEAEDAYRKIINNRNKDITILANKLSIQPPNFSQMSGTGFDAKEFLEQINSKVQETKVSLDVTQKSQEETERQIQVKIDDCREKKARSEQEISSKKDQLKNTDEEYKRVTEDIHQADESVNTLIVLENQLNRVNREIDEANQAVDLKELETSIKKQREEKDRLEDELEQMYSELEKLRELRDDQKKLEDMQKRKTDIETSVRFLKNKHGDTVQRLLGRMPEQHIKRLFSDRLEEINRDIEAKKKLMAKKNDRLISLKASRKNKAEKLADMQNDLRLKENEIYELCENRDLDTVLNSVSDKVKAQQNITGTWSGAEYLYKGYISKLKQPEPCCPLCHRSFDAADEAFELANELENHVKQLPMKSIETLKELDSLLEKQSRLLQLKPTYEKVTALKTVEIPALTEELEDIKKEIDTLQREYSAVENDLIQPKEDEVLGKGARDDIIKLDHLMGQCRDLEREMADLNARLGSKNKGKTYDQVYQEHKKKKESLEEVRKSLDSKRTKLDEQNKKLTNLKESQNKLIKEQYELRGKSQRRAELAEKQSDLQTLKVTLRAELDEATDQLQPLVSKLESLTQELREARSQNQEALEKERRYVQSNENKYKEILKFQHDIDEYEKKNESARLNAIKEELKALEQQKESVTEEIAGLGEQTRKIERFLANLQASRQNLENNKTLRAKVVQEKEYEGQIQELDVRLNTLNFDEVEKERQKVADEEVKIHRKQAQARGTADELEENVKSIEEELNGSDYKNAETNYKNQLIEIKVREMALDDLGNYIVALDWAMIHFHKERMKAINQTIRDLWRQIYSGNDIDTIEIKTDESDTNTADKRRTFNYRVVCKRGETEMDMRGRCSAGQKILACLIIRMALAETFSRNCGILALDEPTTNLDQENIDSLSTALADIIASRAKQKNFQLIVITHDEDFLLRLSHHEKIPFYLKVQRNRYGKSEVVQVATN